MYSLHYRIKRTRYERKEDWYLRVSTLLQNEERQLSGIELDKEFVEKASARDTNRPVLKTMLDFIREGDEVYIHDISRLARNKVISTHS